MKKNRICIFIRVYDRIDDLVNNLEIIRNTWKNNDYYILTVSNGGNDGYFLSELVYSLSDKVVVLDENPGHLKGSSQLLLEGIKYIPNDCAFTVLLEADTWLYTDSLVLKYVNKMAKGNAVWASARWYDRYYSNATDFAIVMSDFLKSNNSIVDFLTFPECYIANYLIINSFKYLYIKELMPVLLPSYIKSYPYAPRGRFYVFPLGKMVTHHVEHLSGGMAEKKFYFNLISNSDYFITSFNKNFYCEKIKIYSSRILSFLLIRRSWYSSRVMFDKFDIF